MKTIIPILILSTCISVLAVIDDVQPLTYTTTLPTAYTLRESEVLVGFYTFDFGLTDHLQVGIKPLIIIFGLLNADGTALIFSGIISVPVTGWLKLHTGPNYLYLTDGKISPENDTSGYTLLMSSSIPVGIELLFNEHNAITVDYNYEIDTENESYFASYVHSWDKFNLQLGLVSHRTWDKNPIPFINLT